MQRKHIAIKSIEEPIGKIILADGSVHTFRIVIGAAYRMLEDDGKTPILHQEGGAAYGFEAKQMFCTVEEPYDLKLTDWREQTSDNKKAN